MKQDTTLINKLWWLNKFLTSHFDGKEYKEVYNLTLSKDVCDEVDELVAHVKENY